MLQRIKGRVVLSMMNCVTHGCLDIRIQGSTEKKTRKGGGFFSGLPCSSVMVRVFGCCYSVGHIANLC